MTESGHLAGDAAAFDVYGYRFTLHGDCAWALDGVAQDFAFFKTASAVRGGPTVRIEMIEAEPDYGQVPVNDASIYTPRNVVYRDGARLYIDYSGRGLAIHDPAKRLFRVTSANQNLLYESVYLFLLSQIGEHQDAEHRHRLHALAVSVRGRAILVLLPMGGGKSTLGAALLDHPDVKLLSDDSPFIDSSGKVHAFPLHLGLLPDREAEVPAEHRRRIERMEFGPKFLINIEYFRDRLEASAEPGLIFLGRRTMSPECRIERAGFVPAMRSMVSNCIIGLGLFHGLEFILSASAWELTSKTSVALSRLDNCLALLRRSETYHLKLGRDVRANGQAVVDFARRRF